MQCFAKDQPDNLAVRFALRVCHRPSVDVHRRLDRSVTHQLLLHLHRSARLVEPRTVGMAEGMPPYPVGKTDEFGDPAKLALLEALLVVRLPCLRIGEYPIPILGKRTEAPPPKQQF